ncbi:unnamed protein product, partial [Meganyctiphanes norvegica]
MSLFRKLSPWRSTVILVAAAGSLVLMLIPNYQLDSFKYDNSHPPHAYSDNTSQSSEKYPENGNTLLSPVKDTSQQSDIPLQTGDIIVPGERAEIHVDTYIPPGEIILWKGQAILHTHGDYVLENTLLLHFNGTLGSEQQFFDILKSRQGICRRMIKLGGGYKCQSGSDGDKAMCLDPGLLMQQNNCLVYSFGVGDDITFEDTITYFKNCEVHLFDPTLDKISQQILLEGLHSRLHFHLLGLSDKNERMKSPHHEAHYLDLRTLDQIQKELGHVGRTINYLKIDIEGAEWKALSYIVQHGLLNSVQQIAMELHTDHLNNQPYETWLLTLQKYLEVLRSIEAAGFHRVQYEVNWTLTCSLKVPHHNVSMPACGEILYVRTP